MCYRILKKETGSDKSCFFFCITAFQAYYFRKFFKKRTKKGAKKIWHTQSMEN